MRYLTATIILCLFFNFAKAQTSQDSLVSNDISLLFQNMSMIGVLGNDISRIDVRFTDVEKISDMSYRINGASRTRIDIICHFKGQINIDSIDFSNPINEECTEIDGLICGHYRLVEEENSGYSGAFSGEFKQAFRFRNGEILHPINDIVENKLNTAEYVGVWQMGSITKICNWADSVIPGTADDFCTVNDAGEWVVNEHLRKNGWDNLYNAYYDYTISEKERLKARSIEEEQWWKVDR